VLCDHIGRKDLAKDPKFNSFKNRQDNRELITKILDQELMKKNTSEWLEDFGGIVPAAPILNLIESLENPFLKDRGNIQTLTTNRGVDISLLKTPIHLFEENHKDITAPELGADTDSVLEEAGFTKEEVKIFKSHGSI
jgi:crotonobetainyl-CoA:carnitine CoA-transferase CaiB-like acyl-CoA transferase